MHTCISRLLALLLVMPVLSLAAETTLRGRVVDRSGEPVAGATVSAGNVSATTAEDGSFAIVTLESRTSLEVRHPKHQSAITAITAITADMTSLEIALEPLPALSESMVVTAIRADDAAPVTKKNIERSEIEERYYGQDIPQLLSVTPSMTMYSDSGMGMNYSYFTLRGIGQTRINMTLDGVPLNDPAENALYFNNFTDFAGTVDSIQIQRGVGTSTVGSPSYGGSVNFTSMPLSETREIAAEVTAGSYGITRASVAMQSGALGDGFAVYGRATWNETDGFRDHSGVEQYAVYLNAAYRTDDSILKLVSFSGREETELSFLAVDEATLEQDLTFNPLDEAERDAFGQDLVELQYSKVLGSTSSLTATAYYNGAQGWFDLWDDPVAQTALLRFQLDQQTLGLMATLNQQIGTVGLNYGVHYNDYEGDHFLTIEGDRQYVNTGFKNEATAFVKAGWNRDRWHYYGDAQFRRAEFSYDGDVGLGSVDWTFFNPKIGARYTFATGLSAYGSVGRASREPTRNDLLAGEDNASIPYDLEAVDPETVIDWEAGVDLATSRLALAVSLYAMEFDDEIALTGELSDIGLPLRRNVEDSYRRGFELDFRWKVSESVSLTGNANLSRNRIREWTQYTDVYGEDGLYLESVPVVYRDVEPLLTPSFIANVGVDWAPRPTLAFGALARYVGESQLDNTGDDRFVTPNFLNVDLKASIGLERFIPVRRPRLNVFVNNVLDNDRIYASGYSYQFMSETITGGRVLDGISYYYPSATRHVMATIDFRL